ncbi:MAG: serine hydrolase [Alphaproteobacteria bacterium]|nr:serine hydrolase [Alphaproteobacteria bacterium]
MTTTATLALEGRIDRLAAAVARPDGPGCALGIARGGEVLLRKGYGLASVEHGVAIGPGTVFRIASVTKQFTCAAVLMLVLEGRLGLDDEVRTHLSWLPDYGTPVTLRHLLHNVSGLRDFLELTRWGGMSLDRPVGEDDLVAAIGRAGGLNFAPGSRFLYSNTNFLLLGRIVERIEGMPLESVLERRFFAPLGMAATLLVRDPATVVPRLATAYLRQPDGTVVRAHQAYPTVGEGGMVSTVDDLLRWARHFDRPFVGGGHLVTALQVELALTGGAAQPYARGLEVGRWRGLRTVGHGGLWPGYRTELLLVPERDLAVVAIANVDAIDPHRLARRAVDAALAEEGLPAEPALPGWVAGHAGRWVDSEELAVLDLAVAGGEATGRMNGAGFGFLPAADGWLRAFRGAFELAVRADGDGLLADTGAGRTVRMARVVPVAPPAGLAGTYHAAELDTTWTVAPHGDGLAVRARGPLAAAGPWPVTPVAADVVEIVMPNRWLTATVVAHVLRGAGGITGLRVSSGRIKNLRFARTA